MKNKSFTFIDLFSGIGGFRLALENIGGSCIGFSEINKDAIKSYCENFNEDETLNFGDITKIIRLPQHDLLTAGVPCQSWSIAGKNLGFDDDRGQLWNDTIYLLNKTRPKAFIFENVKGLSDPRNTEALTYILNRIKEAGYYANYYLLNSYDYGVPQNRIRIYIVGFLDKSFLDKFELAQPIEEKIKLYNILTDIESPIDKTDNFSLVQKDLFGLPLYKRKMSLSQNNGFNDYFLFNDLRNGHSTIHSWDIINTSKRQKQICNILLTNRRKSTYGELDGNPLSLEHFKLLDSSITEEELNELVKIEVFKTEEYTFIINSFDKNSINEDELKIIECSKGNKLNIDNLKSNKALKLKQIPIFKSIVNLKLKNVIKCIEIRYDFKNTKISTGLNGINRIFLPKSTIFPTLVASDTNDYIALKNIDAINEIDFKNEFLQEIYFKKLFRKITQKEACLIQGFPANFKLPDNRARWMKLIGNSVSVPVIQMLGKAIMETGVFESTNNFDFVENCNYKHSQL